MTHIQRLIDDMVVHTFKCDICTSHMGGGILKFRCWPQTKPRSVLVRLKRLGWSYRWIDKYWGRHHYCDQCTARHEEEAEQWRKQEERREARRLKRLGAVGPTTSS